MFNKLADSNEDDKIVQVNPGIAIKLRDPEQEKGTTMIKTLDRDLQALKKADSLRTFEAQAHKYDAALCGQHARELYPHVLREVGAAYRAYAQREQAAGRVAGGKPERALRVLDVGCGTGALASYVLDSLPTCKLIGVDISPEMLRQARVRLGDAATFVPGDAEKLPFGDGSFDLVVMNDVFHHCPDPHRAAFEAWRVLAADGVLVLGEEWSRQPVRAMSNVMLPVWGEGDIRIYSEDELTGLLGQWFEAVEWRSVNSRACIAAVRK